MADPDPRIEALEAQQKAADKDRLERRLLELKRIAIDRRLAEEERDQAAVWKTLTDVVDDAAGNYVDMRVRGLEARLDAKDVDQGTPMWTSLVIAVALSFIPVTALTNALLGALAVGTQKIMRRAVLAATRRQRAEIRGAIRALAPAQKRQPDEEFLTWLKRAASTGRTQHSLSLAHGEVTRMIRTAEKSVAEFYEVIKPEVANQAQEWAKAVLEAAGKVLFNVRDDGSKVDATEAPVVVVRRSVMVQLNERKGDEEEARRAYVGILEKAYAEATEYIELDQGPGVSRDKKEREKRRSEARALIHELYKHEFGLDEYKPFESTPRFEPMEATDFPDLKKLLEMMMWATTFDFKLLSVQHFQLGTGGKNFWKPQIGGDNGLRQLPETLETIPLPEPMWKILLERYIDPDTKQPFGASKDLRTLGTVEKPAPSDAVSKYYPYPLFTPKHRFSYFVSMILAPELEKEIKRVGNDLHRVRKGKARKP